MRAQLSELRSHSGFSALAISRFISNVGNGISPVALAFGVLALPGATGKDLSIVMAARMFPMIALMLFGGVIGDRFKRYGCTLWNFKCALVASDVWSASRNFT